jgi:hypothetical protein
MLRSRRTAQFDPDNGMTSVASPEVLVRHFRQILMWPLRIMPGQLEGIHISKHWEFLEASGEDCPWREVRDEFDDPTSVSRRGITRNSSPSCPSYSAFCMAKEHPATDRRALASPLCEYCAAAISLRCESCSKSSSPPLLFEIAHVDLYFFYDTDIIILVVEFFANDLPLLLAEDVLFKVGRAYPGYWEPSGQGAHCPYRVEWLSTTGDTLAVSDYENRQKYLEFTCQQRSPNVAAHWEYLLQPLSLYLPDSEGPDSLPTDRVSPNALAGLPQLRRSAGL